MRLTITAAAVALFTFASATAYAGGCNYGTKNQSTKVEESASS